MNKQHPFRFGLNASAPSREAWIDTAQKAEALGYDTLLVSDHLEEGLAPLAAMVAAADATTTLRVGSYVFGNDFRHPVYLAKEAATIDLLSDGRFDLGLGTGWDRNDYEMSGIPLDRPGVRVSRLTEAVQIIKGFFAGTPFTFAGKYYTVRGLEGNPKPTQHPHPPLMLGGGGRRMLSLAAREADIVSVNAKTTAEGQLDFSSITAEAADQKMEWVQQAAGTRFDDLTLNILVPIVAVTDKRDQAAAQILRAYNIPANTLNVEQVLESPSALIGTVDQIVEDLQARRERYGFSYIVVWPMEQFAPVVERLAGR
jgi:probable F420-dependent oxidoreductase